MRLLLCLFALGLAAAEELPITGIAHVGFRVSDLEKARSFYTGILGYQEAFALKDDSGKISMAFFKVNDGQYIELSPGAAPDDRLTHYAIETPNIEKLRAMLEDRGLAPGKIQKGRDGNLNCSIKDPDGHRVEFVEYRPGSLHTNARGKFMDQRRVSDSLRHTGVTVANVDAAMAFYRDKLGFRETWRGGPTDAELRWINMRMPGPRGDYVEFMIHSQPPTRSQYGSMHHICLDVPEIEPAYKMLLSHGLPADERHKPRKGRNQLWLLNLFDPDGTRTELMEPSPR